MSAGTKVSWLYGDEQEGLLLEFFIDSSGSLTGASACTPLGAMCTSGEEAEEDWGVGVSALCSFILTAVGHGIISTPQQFSLLAGECLEHLANETT